MSMPDARNTRVAVTRPAATDLLVRIRADGRVLLPLTGARGTLLDPRSPNSRHRLSEVATASSRGVRSGASASRSSKTKHSPEKWSPPTSSK